MRTGTWGGLIFELILLELGLGGGVFRTELDRAGHPIADKLSFPVDLRVVHFLVPIFRLDAQIALGYTAEIPRVDTIDHPDLRAYWICIVVFPLKVALGLVQISHFESGIDIAVTM